MGGELRIRRSLHAAGQPAAFLIRAGLLIIWLQPNVSGFRPVLARDWHGARCLRAGDHSLVSYRHGVGYRRSPGSLASLVTRLVDWSRMPLWSTVVVSIYLRGLLHGQARDSNDGKSSMLPPPPGSRADRTWPTRIPGSARHRHELGPGEQRQPCAVYRCGASRPALCRTCGHRFRCPLSTVGTGSD